jgi:hypothetical protein
VYDLSPANTTLPCEDNRTWTFTNSSNGIPTQEAEVACTSLSNYSRAVVFKTTSISCSNASQVQVVTAMPHEDEHDHCPLNLTLEPISESLGGWGLRCAGGGWQGRYICLGALSASAVQLVHCSP